MPCPQNSRTIEKPFDSACRWTACPMSPRCAPGRTCPDAAPHRLVGDVDEAACLDRWRAHVEHAARVAVVAVLDDRDVDVDDVARLQLALAGNAVADDVVHRRAQRRRVGGVAGRRVFERGRDGLLHADHVVVGQPVDFAGGDAGLDERREVVEDLGGEPARDTHLRDVVGSLDGDRHGRRGSHGLRSRSLMLVFARVFASTCFTMTAQ